MKEILGNKTFAETGWINLRQAIGTEYFEIIEDLARFNKEFFLDDNIFKIKYLVLANSESNTMRLTLDYEEDLTLANIVFQKLKFSIFSNHFCLNLWIIITFLVRDCKRRIV